MNIEGKDSSELIEDYCKRNENREYPKRPNSVYFREGSFVNFYEKEEEKRDFFNF